VSVGAGVPPSASEPVGEGEGLGEAQGEALTEAPCVGAGEGEGEGEGVCEALAQWLPLRVWVRKGVRLPLGGVLPLAQSVAEAQLLGVELGLAVG
jgi:hypothetical protein